MKKELLNILYCPSCHQELRISDNILCCYSCRRKYEIIDGIPIFFDSLEKKEWDINLAKEKWGNFYQGFEWEAERKKYNPSNLPYIYKHLYSLKKGDLFLEIGAGPSFLSFDLAEKGIRVVSVDFDLDILRTAKKYFQKYNTEGNFVCADIHKLPFKNNVFDFSAGIGVVEHSRNIFHSIKEIARVTKIKGYTFQTVPCLSLTTLTLNQRYGTIPHLPILKEIFSFIHINLLKARHMKYGYEESFTLGFLKKIFKKAGFDKIEANFYDYNQTVLKRNKFWSKFFYKLLRLKPFWDIIFIKTYK